jgi:diguanylate cyclase (GGDEF)-like protein
LEISKINILAARRNQRFSGPGYGSYSWLEKSPICTVMIDLEHNLLYMNSAGVEALQMDDVSPYLGHSYPFSFYSAIFKKSMRLAIEQSIANWEVVRHEGTTIDCCGEKICFESTIIPSDEEQGYLVVVSTDVTERRQLEGELKKSHALFSQAEQLGKIGHWEWDVASDRLVSCSDQYAAIFDMSVEEAQRFDADLKTGAKPDCDVGYASDVSAYVHPEDRDHYIKFTDAAYEKGIPWRIEFRVITQRNRVVHVLEIGEPIFNDKGVLVRTFGTIQDITHHKETQEQLNHQASHDALTGLINRREFERRAERLLSGSGNDQDQHALCFMDLDQFKVVNDTCGHAAGDILLKQISGLLKNVVRKRDTLARLGGDEFGLLMEHCSLAEASRVVNDILSTINEYHFSYSGKLFKVGVSIGLTMVSKSTESVTELLQEADAACYIAKEEGRNRVHVHHEKDVEVARRHGEIQWVSRLNMAIDQDRFCLYGQPISPLVNDKAGHYELLIRFVAENGKLVPPGAFLPAAERYNLIAQLDRWVFEHALETLEQSGPFLNDVGLISINVSGPSLCDENFLKQIMQRLRTSSVPAEKIGFEITETAAISNLSKAMQFITSLKQLGCSFSLDDFGSGLSSFAYLKNLPVDYLKIDGMFVKDILKDPVSHAMVTSINQIGQVMGMQTIAEFVEDEDTRQALSEIGVDYVQGYHIGRPRPFLEFIH